MQADLFIKPEHYTLVEQYKQAVTAYRDNFNEIEDRPIQRLHPFSLVLIASKAVQHNQAITIPGITLTEDEIQRLHQFGNSYNKMQDLIQVLINAGIPTAACFEISRRILDPNSQEIKVYPDDV